MNIIPDYLDNKEPCRVQIANKGHVIVVFSSPVLDFVSGDTMIEDLLTVLKKKAKARFFGIGARQKIKEIEEAKAKRGGQPLLFGALVLKNTDDTTFNRDMYFQNASEFPSVGSHVIDVYDRVPKDELKAKSFNKVLGISENRAIYDDSDEEDEYLFSIPAACVVDGRKYITTKFIPFVHPWIVESFKDAQRV